MVAANGFNGSKAFNFGGLSDKGSYCQPLLRLDQLGGETLKDFRRGGGNGAVCRLHPYQNG